MANEPAIDYSQPIALFPLPQCVLLPHIASPLHIFEPRYRAMVRDALASEAPIAMAILDEEDWATVHASPPEIAIQPDASPRLRPTVCVGVIYQHQELPDGRYMLLLAGVARARLVREVAMHDDGYRRALLSPIGRPDIAEVTLRAKRDNLEALLQDEHLQALASVKKVAAWIATGVPSIALPDMAASVLLRQTDERYAVLAEPDPVERFDVIHNHLRSARDTLIRADQQSGAIGDDGLPVN